jgi:CRP/FNR family cyclic AMP-dependent transcriptional regulator
MSDKVLERTTFQAGDTLFKQGDDGSHALIIQSGEVEIILAADEDDEAVLATVGPGGIIGEMALLDQSHRMATARASLGGAAIIVSRQVFSVKMQKTDPFIRGLLLILADRARQMSASQLNSNETPNPEAISDPEAVSDPEAASDPEAGPAPAPESDA